MMDWGGFWNQTSSWGEGAGNKALDQAQVRDAEEAFLAWAEGLLKRSDQGADKSFFGCEKLEQVIFSFRQGPVIVNL